MLLSLLILACVALSLIGLARRRVYAQAAGHLFFAGQAATAIWVALNGWGNTEWSYFTFDALGIAYYVLMGLMGWLCAWQGYRYLERESLREYQIYLGAFIALNLSLTGVYFSNNITVTWILLEATTIAVAGLTYHRRTIRSLEATWKYIFVSSVGIAVAYLGILLLSTIASHGSEASIDLSYSALHRALAAGGGNPLYVKLAFLFILVGYSSKLEIFPFYTVGVDANHVAPAPASAFISSALVGGGFVAIFRVYRVMQGSSELIGWVQHVLLLVGILSLLTAAVYMGRTRNFKRLAAYSTVENSGLAMLGLGIGGIGIWAAVLHSLAHTLIKGSLLLQISRVGKIYGGYKISHYGGYFHLDPWGALVVLCCLVGLIAMPQSLLFKTEFLMLAALIAQGKWWVLLLIIPLLLVVIWWLTSKILPLLYKPVDLKHGVQPAEHDTALSVILLVIVLLTFVFGVWQAPQLTELIDTIVYR